MFTYFSFHPSLHTDEAVGPIFALNTSYDMVLRREVPLRVRTINFNISLIYYNGSNVEIINKFKLS